MAETPNPEKETKANAEVHTHGGRHQRLIGWSNARSTTARCIQEKRQTPAKEQAPSPSTTEESPAQSRRPFVRLHLPEREAARATLMIWLRGE
jgi:hypothetical protein